MQFDFTLTPNGAQKLDVRGKFFKLVRGSGAVRVRTDTGENIDLMPGQGVWNTSFNWITIADRTGAVNTGAMLAGDFDFRDDRISGSVEVIDGGRNRTMANQAFMGRGYTAGAAGNTPELHLWNPAGSGVRLVVERVTRSTSTTGTVHMPIVSAMAGTLLGSATSKLSGGAAGRAQLRSNSTVGNQVASTVLTSDTVTAGTPLVLQFIEPVVILPGFGLYIASTTQGADVSGTFEFWEDVI